MSLWQVRSQIMATELFGLTVRWFRYCFLWVKVRETKDRRWQRIANEAKGKQKRTVLTMATNMRTNLTDVYYLGLTSWKLFVAEHSPMDGPASSKAVINKVIVLLVELAATANRLLCSNVQWCSCPSRSASSSSSCLLLIYCLTHVLPANSSRTYLE